MKIFCFNCKILVAEIITGKRKNGAEMFCENCLSTFDAIKRIDKLPNSSHSPPDFMKDLFGKFGDKYGK